MDVGPFFSAVSSEDCNNLLEAEDEDERITESRNHPCVLQATRRVVLGG